MQFTNLTQHHQCVLSVIQLSEEEVNLLHNKWWGEGVGGVGGRFGEFHWIFCIEVIARCLLSYPSNE